MFAQVLASICIAILVAQSQAAPGGDVRGAKYVSDDDTIDTAKRLAKELEEATHKQVESGVQTVFNVTLVQTKVGAGVVKLAQAKISDEYVELTNQLDKIKSDAASAGKDIASCLQDTEQALRDLPEQQKAEIGKSFSKFEIATQEIASHAVSGIQDSYSAVDFVKQELEKCASAPNTKCVTDIIALINKEKENIRQNIALLIRQAIRDFIPITAQLQREANGEVVSFETEGKQIIDDILECVNKQ